MVIITADSRYHSVIVTGGFKIWKYLKSLRLTWNQKCPSPKYFSAIFLIKVECLRNIIIFFRIIKQPSLFLWPSIYVFNKIPYGSKPTSPATMWRQGRIRLYEKEIFKRLYLSKISLWWFSSIRIKLLNCYGLSWGNAFRTNSVFF
jgi:hypothetical protein